MECSSVSGGAQWARRPRSGAPEALTLDGRGLKALARLGRDRARPALRPATLDPAPRSPQPGSKPAAGDVRRKPPPSAPTSHPLRRHPGGRARCRWASPARGPGRSLACLDVRASGLLLSVMEPHATLSAGIAVRFARQAPTGSRLRYCQGRQAALSCPRPGPSRIGVLPCVESSSAEPGGRGVVVEGRA